jgi:predicted acylesterase/phospholipase RssA
MTKKDIEIPPKQRALVFQGGGSLGAYEAGVYHVLYYWINKDLDDDENVFDIIAGTSIGAVNASIIINEILEKKKRKQEESLTQQKEKSASDKILNYWQDTPKKLIEFWKNVSSSSNIIDAWDPWNLADIYRSFIENYLKFNYGLYLNIFPYMRFLLPSEESFRNYYHTQMALAYGEKHIFRPLFIYPFSTPGSNKFFDYSSPTAKWFQYTNLPLRNSIVKSVNILKDDNNKNGKGIKTIYDEKEPRLLLIAVDIREAKSRTFDSYNENITINHVLASAAVPKNYPYVDIEGNKYWDGGILSNTPVREVLSEHSKLWTERLEIDEDSDSKRDLSYEKEKEWFKKYNKDNNQNKKDDIPDLDLCVVNLYPSSESGEQIPPLYDYDLTKDRENDIKFHDKTEYDIKMANVVSDYHDFVERIGELAIKAIEEIKDKDEVVIKLKKKFIDILGKKQRTLTRDEKPRYFYDLLKKRFNIEKIIEIQRQDDIHTIANKALDFSSETISKLIEQGIYDTLDKIYQEQKENHKKEFFMNWLTQYIKNIEKENTKDILKPVLEFKEKKRL